MLTQDELTKICKLARLQLEEGKSDAFLQKLNSVFEWVKQLQNIDTSSVEKTAMESPQATLIERKDVVNDGDCRELILSNTEFKKFDMFSVPKVVE